METETVVGSSWTHRLARIAVRPLVGTGLTPNHLTSLRLATGVLACAALLPDERVWDWWAGWLWLASAFLDRADGELARLAGMATPGGHRYDYIVDNLVNAGFFVALGLGLRDSALGQIAVAFGIATGAALYVCGIWSEALERLDGAASKAYSGAFGFDPDDLLYLLAPIVWIGWKAPLIAAAFVGATGMMLLTGWRLRRLTEERRAARAAD
jgi:phosphatidylglycerophosphate synthase